MIELYSNTNILSSLLEMVKIVCLLPQSLLRQVLGPGALGRPRGIG